MVVNRRIIIDAGPIVAAINGRDQWASTTVKLFSELTKPFYTCEAVISEACHLLTGFYKGRILVMEMVASGVIRLDFKLSEEIDLVTQLMKKYDDIPMSLADACLVRMSELHFSKVFTFDGDFRIYRHKVNQNIPLIVIAS